jgi:hypothetical protein
MTTPVELYTNPLAATTVSSGGTTAPAPGTSESWTMAGAYASWPQVTNVVPATQIHVYDQALPSEVMLVTNMSGATWTVTRGAEGTTPVVHAAGFAIQQVVSASVLTFMQQKTIVSQTSAQQTFSLVALTAVTGLAALLVPGTYDIELELFWTPAGTIGSNHSHQFQFSGTINNWAFNGTAWQTTGTSTANDQRTNYGSGTVGLPIVWGNSPTHVAFNGFTRITGRLSVATTGVFNPSIALGTANNSIIVQTGSRMVVRRLA